MDSDHRMLATRRQWLAGTLALLPAGLARGQVPVAEPPAAIDLSNLCTPAKDQGDRNTCSFFAVVAAAEAILMRDFGRREALSEEWLIYQHNQTLPRPAFDETTDIGDVLKLAQEIGLPPESTLPYQPTRFAPGSLCASKARSLRSCGTPAVAPKEPDADCFVQRPPPTSVSEAAARLKVVEVGGFTPTVDGVCHRLGVRRTPVIAALKLPDCYEGWGDDGLVRASRKTLGLSEDQSDKIPNHVVLITGYDMASQMFTFKCSWGPSWGRNGYGRISFTDTAPSFVYNSTFVIKSLTVA